MDTGARQHGGVMARAAASKPRSLATARVEAASILGALSDAVIVVGPGNRIAFVNPAAEQFFRLSAVQICAMRLDELVPADSAFAAVVAQARSNGASVSEDGISLSTPRIGEHFVTLRAAPLSEDSDTVVVSLHERSIARKIDLQLVHRNAARSVSAMAALLAHEVKNPLSGIRGAAQLLEPSLPPEERELTRLICDETDRICALVDRMEIFSDQSPLERGPVNIHRVLERVRKVAQSGFARHLRFIENYDPSLPTVLGNRDQLVQVFLNLVKNAAEACPPAGGEIVLTTAYQHGVHLALPGSDSRLKLPLVVSVQDNGEGIPEDIRAHLFDPFVTTKVNGSGLGLALVAKMIGDHGGVVEFDSQPRRTVFRVMLPIHGSADEG